MPRLLLILATVSTVAVVLAIASAANACPPQAFSSCYAAPVQAYAPVVSYAQPVYAPLQTYSHNAPAQALVVPGKVQITQPQVTLSLSQVQGYAAPVYATPFVQSYSLGVQGYGHAAIVQKQFVQHHHNNNGVAALRVGPFGGSVTIQNDGDVIRRGPLGRVLSIRKN